MACTYPSIHFFHVGRHSLDHGRLPDVRCGVCGVGVLLLLLCTCGVVCGVGGVGVVWCWWCWWWWWCVVLVVCGCCVVLVLVWCGVAVYSVCVFSLFFPSILFFLFLALSSLFSLLATKHCEAVINQHGVQCDMAHDRCTALAPLLSHPLPSSPLPPPFFPFHPKKKSEGPFYYRNISGEEFIFYYSFKLIPKTRRRGKLQTLQFYINSKTIGL